MRAGCYLVLLVAAAAAGLSGCQSSPSSGPAWGSSIPRLDAASASAAGLSAEQATEAASLYTGKCIRCHKSYDPARYSGPLWHSWMNKMSKKARLNPPQAELLSRYLDAYRASAGAGDEKAGAKTSN